MFHDASEAIKDLFRHERITIIDENGKEVTKVVKPEPLQNPITLLRMLTWRACTYTLPLSLDPWGIYSRSSDPFGVTLTKLSSIGRAILRRRLGLLDR